MDGFNYSYQNGSSAESDFNKLSHTMSTNIPKISQNVSSIQKMVNQLGTPQETPQLKNKLQELQHYTKQLVTDTSSNLEELMRISNPPSASEAREWKLKKDKFTEEFSAVLSSFQQAQRSAMQREKESLERARANSELSYSLEAPPGGSNNLIELHGNKQKQLQALEDLENLEMLREQERGIRQLENDILSVNELFKNLGRYVHDQGEVVDSIEAHVEMGASQISEAAQQLRMANTYQNKSRRKKFCLIMTAIIILTVIILIIILTSR